MFSDMKVLIVDDEERFLKTTQKIFEKKGIETQTASNGRDAMGILQLHPIDVVVLDIKMPGIDGIRVLRNIKEKHPLVEVIMLTGHATVKNAVKGVKFGAFDYLMKPCDPLLLSEKVNKAYNKKKAVEENIPKEK
jgi:DNA-binding NtrC family response regulator